MSDDNKNVKSDGSPVNNDLHKSSLAIHSDAAAAAVAAATSGTRIGGGQLSKNPILLSSASSPSIVSMARGGQAPDQLLKAAAISAYASATDKSMPPPKTQSTMFDQASGGGSNSLVSNWMIRQPTNSASTSPCPSPFLGRRTPQFFIPDSSSTSSKVDTTFELDPKLFEAAKKLQQHQQLHNLGTTSDFVSRLGSHLVSSSGPNTSPQSAFPSSEFLSHKFPPNDSPKNLTVSGGIGRNKSYQGLIGDLSKFCTPTAKTQTDQSSQKQKIAEIKSPVDAKSAPISARQNSVQNNNNNKKSSERSSKMFRFDVANFDINAVGPSSW